MSSLLDQADASLSSLNYAIAIQKLASSVGFDWTEINGVINKIHEELDEVQFEIKQGKNSQYLHDEMGDLLFACLNLARHLNINPDSALQSTSKKFKQRFHFIEQQISTHNKKMTDHTLEELDALWDAAKLVEKNNKE